MKTPQSFTRPTITIAILCVSLMLGQEAQTAPLQLSDEPLFLLTSAKSNMFFLFDDSISMKNEVITNDYNIYSQYDGGVVYGGPAPHSSGDALWTNVFTSGLDVGGLTYNVISGGSLSPKAARAYGYNTLYYNPNNTYDAWPDTLVSDCKINNARINPNDSTNTEHVILNTNWNTTTKTYLNGDDYAAGYYEWDDKKNGTGAVGYDDGYPQDNELTFVKVPNSLAITQADKDKQEQNFANWFCYHRTRQLAAKSAVMSSIMTIPAKVPMRIGLDAFSPHSSTTDRNFALTDVTANTLVTGDAGMTTRIAMANKIKPFLSDGGTPTFAAFQRAGDYFKCNGNATMQSLTSGGTASTCGMLDVADGRKCGANFAVIVTDGVFADSATSTGDNTVDVANPLNTGTTTYPSFVSTPYVGSTSNTLADIAMDLYNTDFDKTTDNKVPTVCGVDENSAQHLVTFAVTLGIRTDVTIPATPKLGIANNCTSNVASFTTSTAWKETSAESNFYKINQLAHATYNGRGKFFNATSSAKLTKSLSDIITDASSRRGAAAAVGLSSTSNSSGTVAYLSTYYSGYWYGELGAYSVTAGVLSNTATWSANDKLDNDSVVTAANRTIVTYDPASGGIPFAWDTTKLTAAQQADLNASDSKGSLRLDFIRGDHKCEAGYLPSTCAATDKIFRDRIKSSSNNVYTRLGDLINSAPIYVGTPVGNYPDSAPFPVSATTRYSAFKNGTVGVGTTRPEMLYVGGNDGMLHAFTAANTSAGGVEKFAFIPNALSLAGGSKLHALTETSNHRSYVDLTPTIADAYTTTPQDSSNRIWRTILVGGLRHGGKGIYALDITDPGSITNETTAAGKVMWEFTEDDDDNPPAGDMGYTYSQPVIVPLYVSAGTAGVTTVNDIEWFAVFGNGYGSATGRAVLYLVKLSGPTQTTGTGSRWKKDVDYFKIVLGGTDNGLSSPAVVALDTDGIYSRAYAGDLKGNLWAFDLSSKTPTTVKWGSAYGTTSAPEPLFTAAVPTLTPAVTGSTPGNPQPITVKPVVVRNTGGSGGPNVLVLFGTGEYIANGDQNIADVQSFYGVWDKGTNIGNKGTASTADDTSPITPVDLVKQTITQTTFTTGGTTLIRTLSNSAVDYGATTPPMGWYMDLKTEGKERVVSKADLLGNTLLFSTITPTSNPCGGGGTSWLMAVNPINGNDPGIPTFNADGSTNGVINALDNTASGAIVAGVQSTSVTPEHSYIAGDNSSTTAKPCASGSYVQGIGTSTDATTTTQGICAKSTTGQSGRLSWRQLHF